jgi:hypothetical protein
MRLAMLLPLPLLLIGCAPLAPQPTPAVHYRCADGRGFAVYHRPADEAAGIEIAGMRFGLLAEPGAGAGRRYACEVLALTLDGDRARVEMQGQPIYDRCRRQE